MPQRASVYAPSRQCGCVMRSRGTERDLRMSKVKQNVSGSFRKRKLVRAYCRIWSYPQALADQGHAPIVAIQMALFEQLHTESVG